jgi:hypothetical protein
MYTDEKLKRINGTPKLDQCIRMVLNPANFIDRLAELDSCISEFNKFLGFDKWRVVRQGADIQFKKLEKIEIEEPSQTVQTDTEDEFLRREFSNVSVHKIGLDGMVSAILEQRIKEIEKCYSSGAYLSVILIAGSTLEGILLGLAIKNPKNFNTSASSPKDGSGKVRQFHEWSLSAFIDVAYELRLVQHDIQKFSHTLRDFRNYIHPFQQMSSGFNPRQHTAKICLQVLKAAIHDIGENVVRINT